MADPFPSFPVQSALPDDASWCAVWLSWDQRTDWVYYLVVRREQDGSTQDLIARIHAMGANERDKLVARLEHVATTQQPNTEHNGGPMLKGSRDWLMAQQADEG